MSTSQLQIDAHRPLAEFAWKLKKKYGQTFGWTKKSFMHAFEQGEIALSSVFENLFVVTRNFLGFVTKKTSVNHHDFSVVTKKGLIASGDFKMSTLQKDGPRKRKFQIDNCMHKIGNIYSVCWNWITEQPCFFVIPPGPLGVHTLKCYNIPVHPVTGERTGGMYNKNCVYETWEEMCGA